VVGRAAGREQADAALTIAFSSTHLPERAIIVAVPADLGEPMRGGARQFLAQLGARIDEGGAGHVEAHHSIIIWLELAVP
jgi:hypothetical protein